MKSLTSFKTLFQCAAIAGIIGITSLFSAVKAEAHSGHTPNVCSTTAPSVCAHLGFDAEPNSTDAWSFMLHFMPAAGIDPKLITNVSVKLWMDMGSHSHGSSPVTVNPVDDVHYEVTDGYFPMSGPWQVKVGFTYQGTNHEIIVPLSVK